jgi:antitoxin CptB
MTGTNISSAGLDERRRRLLFRSWHRGMREMDLILGGFADAEIATMSEAELDLYEALQDEGDLEIFTWITGEQPVPPKFDTPVFRKIQALHTHSKPIYS